MHARMDSLDRHIFHQTIVRYRFRSVIGYTTMVTGTWLALIAQTSNSISSGGYVLTPVGLLCAQYVFDSGTCAGVTVVTQSIHVVGENRIAIWSITGIMGKPHGQHNML